MSVSSVNLGNSGLTSSQPALKSALPPRAGSQPGSSAVPSASTSSATSESAVSTNQTDQPGSESAIVSLGAPTMHANRVGVAAYVAIMNPPAAASMRTEA